MSTGHPDVDAVLGGLLPGISGALGGRLLGAYLFGSVASGDYDPDVSDIDVLVVLESELTAAEFAGLESMHRSVAAALPAWADRVEVLYVSREALRTFRGKASPIAVVSPGEPLNVKSAGIEWLMNWWSVREQGVVLVGPPAGEFIGPISNEEFVDVIGSYGQEFRHRLEESGKATWQAYITLTMCRTMYTCELRSPVSKRAAAEWAAERFPEWSGHIAGALSARMNWRAGLPATPAVLEETARFVEFALAQVWPNGQ